MPVGGGFAASTALHVVHHAAPSERPLDVGRHGDHLLLVLACQLGTRLHRLKVASAESVALPRCAAEHGQRAEPQRVEAHGIRRAHAHVDRRDRRGEPRRRSTPSSAPLTSPLTCSGVSPIRPPPRASTLQQHLRRRLADAVVEILQRRPPCRASAHQRPAYASSASRSGAEQLDLDRLRRAGEVVDHVREDLHELDVQARHRRRRPSRARRRSPRRWTRSRSARGLRRATMSPRFCSVANRPSSAPVRRDVPVDLRGRREDLLRRCAPRGRVSASDVPPGAPVVEHERPLVHLRQERRCPRTGRRRTPPSHQPSAAADDAARVVQHRVQRALARSVADSPSSARPTRRARRACGPLASASCVGDELRAEQRDDREREHQRHQHGDRERERRGR